MAGSSAGSAPTIADWLTAIGTVSTAILALLLATRDQLRAWFFRPRLEITIKQGPPDCTTIQATGLVSFGQHGQVPFQENQFYCRFSVDNAGRSRASNVAVRLMRMWRHENGTWIEDENFFPLHLKWSHIGTTVTPALDPRLPRHCDLCHTTENVPDRFHLETEVEPNEVAPDVYPTVKPPGRYRLEVAITSANAQPQYAIADLTSDGHWAPDAVEMATQHLVPVIVRQRGRPYGAPE